MSLAYKTALLSAVCVLSFSGSAYACLSCGCGSSGVSGDLGALGGTSSIFSKGSKFLVQFGSSYRIIDGSFNESGHWNPMPTGGIVNSFQNSLSLMYMPTQDLSFGIQAPLVTNILSKATWGSFGSIDATDIDTKTGISLGDLNLQGTYKFLETDNNFALAGWLNIGLPTGNASGQTENLSGSGVFSGSGGVLALKQWNNFETFLNIGYQVPFGNPQNTSTAFYIGQSLLYQVQGNYKITDNLRLGLGINGYFGKWLFSNNSQSLNISSLKIVPSVQYDFDVYNGIRFAVGYNPKFGGTNSLTDISIYTVLYHFIQ